jgi:hypothetical protein
VTSHLRDRPVENALFDPERTSEARHVTRRLPQQVISGALTLNGAWSFADL